MVTLLSTESNIARRQINEFIQYFIDSGEFEFTEEKLDSIKKYLLDICIEDIEDQYDKNSVPITLVKELVYFVFQSAKVDYKMQDFKIYLIQFIKAILESVESSDNNNLVEYFDSNEKFQNTFIKSFTLLNKTIFEKENPTIFFSLVIHFDVLNLMFKKENKSLKEFAEFLLEVDSHSWYLQSVTNNGLNVLWRDYWESWANSYLDSL